MIRIKPSTDGNTDTGELGFNYISRTLSAIDVILLLSCVYFSIHPLATLSLFVIQNIIGIGGPILYKFKKINVIRFAMLAEVIVILSNMILSGPLSPVYLAYIELITATIFWVPEKPYRYFILSLSVSMPVILNLAGYTTYSNTILFVTELVLIIYLIVFWRSHQFLSTLIVLLDKANLEIKNKKEQFEKLAQQLAKYLSPQVYDSIFLGDKEVKIETYYKDLTVLFSDIVGFTGRAETMEIGQLTTWLNNYLDKMSNIALDYDGTLDKFIGDAVMIFFGDPASKGKKEDARQCIKMALEMIKTSKKLGIHIRIGVNTGECMVGNFGSEDRMDYTIIGKEVNLTAHLEANSEPDKILISESTYELVKDSFKCIPRESIRAKGIDRDITTYWVIE